MYLLFRALEVIVLCLDLKQIMIVYVREQFTLLSDFKKYIQEFIYKPNKSKHLWTGTKMWRGVLKQWLVLLVVQKG